MAILHTLGLVPYSEMFSIDRPPVALITGGNKGLGLETGRQLAQQGVLVVLGSRDIEAGRAAAASLRALGPGMEAVQLDVTDETSIVHARDQLSDLTGRLDVLINNAGIIVTGIAP
jgi:NAD(P)-dependent dehydrogenase (short-subunit alcohol dehydrogenase family)